jgi:hypothetical protein
MILTPSNALRSKKKKQSTPTFCFDHLRHRSSNHSCLRASSKVSRFKTGPFCAPWHRRLTGHSTEPSMYRRRSKEENSRISSSTRLLSRIFRNQWPCVFSSRRRCSHSSPSTPLPSSFQSMSTEQSNRTMRCFIQLRLRPRSKTTRSFVPFWFSTRTVAT